MTADGATGPFLCPLDCRETTLETRKFCELSSEGKELQTFNAFKVFLEELVQDLESTAPTSSLAINDKR